MKTSGFSPASMAGRIGAAGGIGIATGGGASGVLAPQALSGAAPVSPELAQIRYASTWPRGWMAAAVPQRVREFNVQASKAQLTLLFLAAWDAQLESLQRSVLHQLQLPSAAGYGRAQQALQQVRSTWAVRHSSTLGSLDESLTWSPVQPARKRITLQGWSAHTLQAESEADRELVAFSLLGQETAHGAWLASMGRSTPASHFALAAALAPLGIQLDAVHEDAIVLSVDERHWPQVQHNCMVRGQGRRFPAGQWVQPNWGHAPGSVQPAQWQLPASPAAAANAVVSAADAVDAVDDLAQAMAQEAEAAAIATAAYEALQRTITTVRGQVASLRAQVQQFCDAAQASVAHAQPDQLQRMQAFASAFARAGQTPVYDWVHAVVPAVRTISRLRVARLLRRTRRSGL